MTTRERCILEAKLVETWDTLGQPPLERFVKMFPHTDRGMAFLLRRHGKLLKRGPRKGVKHAT